MNNSFEIKSALRNQFKEGTSKMAKRICYGYSQEENGNLVVNIRKELNLLQVKINGEVLFQLN